MNIILISANSYFAAKKFSKVFITVRFFLYREIHNFLSGGVSFGVSFSPDFHIFNIE